MKNINKRSLYENIIIDKNENALAGFGFVSCVNIVNSTIKNVRSAGFINCINVSSCVVNNSDDVGFAGCKKLNRNKVISAHTKYDSCYSSENVNATYLIAQNGSDNVNGGFNT